MLTERERTKTKRAKRKKQNEQKMSQEAKNDYGRVDYIQKLPRQNTQNTGNKINNMHKRIN